MSESIPVTFLTQLKYLSYDELTGRMGNLDQDMEREIEDLRRRYHAKRFSYWGKLSLLLSHIIIELIKIVSLKSLKYISYR